MRYFNTILLKGGPMQANTDLNYKETIPHGNETFPIKLYYTVLKHPEHDLYLHWHDEIEIIYITAGKGTFIIDLIEYPVQKGDILFIKKGALHSGIGDALEGCECHTLILHPNFLKSYQYDQIEARYLTPLLKEELCIAPHLNHSLELQELMMQIINQFQTQSTAYELMIKALSLQLLATLFQNHLVSEQVSSSKKVTALKTVLAYIHEHYGKKIKIHELAQLVGYSDYHFLHFFKQEAGMTCIDYINQIRLQKAYHLLTTTDESITQVAYDCGFENLSYFTKKFKEKYRVTPSKSRQKRIE